MDLGLRGKCAIVTGGSRGIGKATARSLAREGARVVIVARTRESLEQAAAELAKETGSPIFPVPADTGDDDSVKKMVAEAAGRLGGVDILVNCAAQPGGQTPVPKLAEITNEAFWADMNVKVLGYLRCIREVAPLMASRGGGRIVNVSGLAARSTGSIIGSMRNVAVSALTKNISDELAPLGISSVVLHPGGVRTERTPDVVRNHALRRGVGETEIEREMASRNAIGRIVDMSEIAEIVAFLASPKAAAINGDAIAAGGGTLGPIHY